jgi:hypothetical protein
MAVYLAGLLLLAAAIELTLALFLASEGKVPSPSSDYWTVYLVVDIALFTSGGVLVPRGLETLRSQGIEPPEDLTSQSPPPG